MDLSKLAATMLTTGGFDVDSLSGLQVDLVVLCDPAVHGTVANPDLGGMDPKRRALLVMEGGRSGWVFDPDRSGQELVATAAREAQVKEPERASVASLEAISTSVPVAFASVPQPHIGPAVRPPAVAGTFYPGQPDALSKMVDELIPKSSPPKRAWPAAMVPHAGLKYSGRIAAAVFQQIEMPDTIIVLAPKHTRLGVEWAVAPHETWSLPGISIASDPGLARQLSESISGLEPDASAHAREHAIEVQLPLLARFAPHARIVGIAVGAGKLERCTQFATGLAQVLRDRTEPVLLVISTDMNHFANDAETRQLDERALTALDRLDPEQLFQTVRRDNISMCGLLPAVIVLETLRQLGRLKQCQRVGYATTADTTGDPTRVVGYAGLLLG
jgi:AmmeMemoRadiSam system protein B